MNNASLTKSDRLQRVYKVLKDGQPHTTRDIIRKAHVCAVNSVVAELRENNKEITCKRNGDKWYYQMPRKASAVARYMQDNNLRSA